MNISLSQAEISALKGEFTLSITGAGGPPPSSPPVPALPVPAPGHTVTIDPPYAVTGNATMFGLNWDGSIDSGDNGIGFFINPASNADYRTRSKTLVGVSLPREVMLSTFLNDDSWQTDGIDAAWQRSAIPLIHYVSNYQPLLTIDSGGHTDMGCQLVDAGPSASTHAALDLTYAVAHQLGTGGKALATYMILVDDNPIQIRGWDFTNKRVIGS